MFVVSVAVATMKEPSFAPGFTRKMEREDEESTGRKALKNEEREDEKSTEFASRFALKVEGGERSKGEEGLGFLFSIL